MLVSLNKKWLWIQDHKLGKILYDFIKNNGVRQGWPVSVLLFVLANEFMFIDLKSNKVISEIKN